MYLNRFLRRALPVVLLLGGTLETFADSWVATSTVGAPIARQRHTAISTGTKMIVWGGCIGSVTKGDGAAYDRVLNSWTSISSVGAPGARCDHTAVWTGSVMIIWGGGTSGSNTGGRYDPVANSWSSTTTTGAPSARTHHSAVWTGSKMIIWGGDNLSPTGGLYDPSTNSWTSTTTTGAPSARSDATAVWTGSRMIVWGGVSGSYENTGGQYDPVANSWTSTSTTGAPTARTEHTAVWADGYNKMVVWGGRISLNNVVNTGGYYDPTSNSWSATPTTNAPAIRKMHSAIWTQGNSLMIVWGGLGSTLLKLNTGGRLDLGSNTWTATTTVGAPIGRYHHSAVFESSKMLIWGGENTSNVETNTGGVYSF